MRSDHRNIDIGRRLYSNYVRAALNDPERERSWERVRPAFRAGPYRQVIGARGKRTQTRIQPTEELRAYLKRAPSFRYGAFDLNSGGGLAGHFARTGKLFKDSKPYITKLYGF